MMKAMGLLTVAVRRPAGWLRLQHLPEPLDSMIKKLLLIFSFLLMFVGAAMLSERPAYAYADPGSGLLAIQAAGSALVATGWYLRRKIYALFHRSVSKQQFGDPPAPDSEDPPSP